MIIVSCCVFFVCFIMDRHYGCAVLAGGAGRRMEKLNKAELNLAGRSFLNSICSEFEKAGFKGYISIANYDQEVPEGWLSVRDTVTGINSEFVGPIGGICSCLKQAEKDGLDGLFFAPCDAPYVLDYVRTIVIDTAVFSLDENIFRNINSVEDYSKIFRSRKRHILICGKRQVGKTTLINRVISDAGRPVYGFVTKSSAPDESGIRHIGMYPAGNSDSTDGTKKLSPDNHIGDTCEKVLSINTEVFDRLGVSLIRRACPDGILIMDELGFMEENAYEFRNAVLAALGSDIPILAAVKDTDKECSFLEAVRNHPDAELLMIDKENRDALFRYVRDIVKEW